MNVLEAVSIVVGLFALRFAVPLAFTWGFSNGMNRLVDRLEA